MPGSLSFFGVGTLSELMGKLFLCTTLRVPGSVNPSWGDPFYLVGPDSKYYIVGTHPLTETAGPANPLPSTSAVTTYPVGPSLRLMGVGPVAPEWISSRWL